MIFFFFLGDFESNFSMEMHTIFVHQKGGDMLSVAIPHL